MIFFSFYFIRDTLSYIRTEASWDVIMGVLLARGPLIRKQSPTPSHELVNGSV